MKVAVLMDTKYHVAFSFAINSKNEIQCFIWIDKIVYVGPCNLRQSCYKARNYMQYALDEMSELYAHYMFSVHLPIWYTDRNLKCNQTHIIELYCYGECVYVCMHTQLIMETFVDWKAFLAL